MISSEHASRCKAPVHRTIGTAICSVQPDTRRGLEKDLLDGHLLDFPTICQLHETEIGLWAEVSKLGRGAPGQVQQSSAVALWPNPILPALLVLGFLIQRLPEALVDLKAKLFSFDNLP
jgi:hypothetical protein